VPLVAISLHSGHWPVLSHVGCISQCQLVVGTIGYPSNLGTTRSSLPFFQWRMRILTAPRSSFSQHQIIFRVITLQTMWNSPTIPWRFAALLPMLSVTHIMPVLVLLLVVGVGMKQTMHDPIPKLNAQVQQTQECYQLTINSLGLFSLTRFFSRLFPDF